MIPGGLAQVESLFATPALAAAGAIAISIPILIHLLSRARRKRVTWGAMRWLLEAYRKQRRKMRFQHWLLLIVRCLAVLVLGLALAGWMLGGQLGQWLGTTTGVQRAWVLVVADHLSTSAIDAQGQTRMDQIKAQAIALLDQAQASGSSNDTVTVIASGRPARVLVNSSPQWEDARQAIESLEARAVRPMTLEALALAREPIEQANEQGAAVVMAILDDWSVADDRAGQPLPSSLMDIASDAEVWATEPMSAVSNVQIVSVTPRRSWVLTGAMGGRTLPVSVGLERHGNLAAKQLSLNIRLIDPQGQAVGQAQRIVRMGSGQAQTTVSVEVALPQSDEPMDVTKLTIEASLLATGGEVVQLDDVRWSEVEVDQQLDVAIVSELHGPDAMSLGGLGSMNAESTDAAHWLAWALSPGANQRGVAMQWVAPVTLSSIVPEHETVQVWLVTKPSLVSASGWRVLAEHAQRGALVWVWPDSDVRGTWWETMTAAMGLEAGLGTETINLENNSNELNASAELPAVLSSLSADWQNLLQPVRVYQAWPMTLDQDSVWLSTVSGQPILGGRAVGQGAWVVSAVQLNETWTNLATKPLWVPLVHEVIRGVLGGETITARAEQPAVLVGDMVESGQWMTLADSSDPTSQTSLTPVNATESWPTAGAWLSSENDVLDTPDQVIVNPDIAGGRTQAMETATLERWLSPLGPVQVGSPDAMREALLAEGPRMSLAWPLLWIVLGLVLVETFLARGFSNAQTGGGARSLVAWLWQHLWGGRREARA